MNASLDVPAELAQSRQLVLVVAPDWNACTAQLQRFVRTGLDREWRPVGTAVPTSLGRSGLAWGRGLHPWLPGRDKREGDGCSPAGIFAITALFGYTAPETSLTAPSTLPFLRCTPDLKAIDDPGSSHYNRIVESSRVSQPDWNSSEEMRRSDGRYAVGAVVGHNTEPVLPGAGSCIFLHVWERAGAPTAGCTAMALADMSGIAGWLDAAAAPLLVQLPQAEYEKLRSAWGLPRFKA